MKHKRLINHLISLVIALGLVSWLHAAPTPATHEQNLPIVAQQANGDAPVLLVEHDTGFVSATTWHGRFFLVYQTRPDGHAHFVEHVGHNTLADVDDPLIRVVLAQMLPARAPPSPAFDLPGPKQGSASLVADETYIRIYYTGRAPGDLTGPFYVWWVPYTPTP